ncbi:MAG TPA: hypothetical protein VI603_02205 [Saprospiraceae bacterium]|nr:hypothetical protein [Saprospiraceae bacterium]
MQIAEIRQLLQSLHVSETELIETHISWVILLDTYAYKLKRPVRFSFLDFTTLDLRHQYCMREVELNQRLTEGIYLGVVPVYKSSDAITIGESKGEIIDYAVKMRRMPQDRQMDMMLRKNQVSKRHIEQIAERLSAFHASAKVPSQPPDPDVMVADFTDLGNYAAVMRSRYGASGEQSIKDAIIQATDFLHSHTARIRERHALGFVVDGHGDLHSKNIFLLDKPVIFDCIEFNDHLRHVDVLDELAFFCLDLELYGKKDLALYFLEHYLVRYPCILTDEDRLLFRYFLLYRAGVKLKINLIKATDPSQILDRQLRWENVNGYYKLFEQYRDLLKKEAQSIYH